MYFLDTNALYWYMGRDKIGDSSCAKVDEHALRSFLDKRIDDKVLASSAYIEAMVITILFFMSILLLYTKCVINNSDKICPNHDSEINYDI